MTNPTRAKYGEPRRFFTSFDCSQKFFILCVISLLTLFIGIFMNDCFAGAQEDIGSAFVNQKLEDDPLAEDMVPSAIQERLDTYRTIIDEVANETIRSQWTRTIEYLEMQLERLNSLESDFSSEPIEHPADTPPYPLSYLDLTRQKYRNFRDMHKLLEDAYQAAQKRIQIAEETYNIAKQQIKTLEEEGSTAEKKQSSDLEYRLGKEVLIYTRLDARLINQKRKQAKKNVERFEQTIPDIQNMVIFSEQDYKDRLQNISKREKALKDAIDKTEQELLVEHRKIEDEQIQVNQLDSLQELLNEAASYLHLEQSIWKERRKLCLKEASMKDMVEWHEKNSLMQQEIKELMRVKELREQEHTKVLTNKEKKESVAATLIDVELEKEIFLRRQLAFNSLDTVAELLKDHLEDLERSRNVRQIQFLKEKVLRVSNAIWRLELAVVQDRTITVGKIFTAIVLFIVGLIVLRLLINRYLYFILRKLPIREGISFTVSHLLFYVVLFVLLLGVISYAGIPFHIFAFLGGALAIAAGFGSQKILSNFLSGVMLMLEGSIRVGDMVQVDETQGTIKSIGLRHTQLTTFTNIDILIPNAKFLEENVINWTLRSDIIRSDIAIGVYFNAPVNTVIEILAQVAADHPKILKEPEPEAFLERINCDRGYLRFNVYYWLRMNSPRDRLIVESALRMEIINRLSTQDVHLAGPTQDIILHRGSALAQT